MCGSVFSSSCFTYRFVDLYMCEKRYNSIIIEDKKGNGENELKRIFHHLRKLLVKLVKYIQTNTHTHVRDGFCMDM